MLYNTSDYKWPETVHKLQKAVQAELLLRYALYHMHWCALVDNVTC